MRNLKVYEDWHNKEPHIEVFISKSLQFRAKIKEEGNPAYEVTVGSSEWNKGKGRVYEERIKNKCKKLADAVNQRYLKVFVDTESTYELLDSIDREEDAKIFGI